MNRTEALAQGFTVDDTCYPWVAYKGMRFAPEEIHPCLTDLEAEMMVVITDIINNGWAGYDHMTDYDRIIEAAKKTIAKVKKERDR